MPEARGAPQRLCASAELAERGDAVLFDRERAILYGGLILLALIALVLFLMRF